MASAGVRLWLAGIDFASKFEMGFRDASGAERGVNNSRQLYARSNAKDARTCSHVQAHPSAIPQKPHHSIRWDICVTSTRTGMVTSKSDGELGRTHNRQVRP